MLEADRVVGVPLKPELLAAIRERGVTVLLVEQRAQRTVAFADRTYVLGNGELRMTLSPSEAGDTDRMIAAYRHPDRAAGRHAMTRMIIALSAGVPAALTELRTLGRTLKRRATDILAYFDRPGTSEQIVCVAPAGVRRAANGAELAERVTAVCDGLEVRVLTGEEEARSAFIGASWALGAEASGRKLAVVDVGGGGQRTAGQ